MSENIKPIHIKALIVLGILVALMPFLGFGFGRVVAGYVLFALGVAIAVISFMVYSRAVPKELHPDAVHNERAPENVERAQEVQ